MLRFLSRQQIDDAEWDRCVGEAHNALLYGHSWYLDAVTDVPGTDGPGMRRGNVPTWRWEGLVQLTDDGAGYMAVLPVPLRRRWGRWVVYQPLFCQFLAIFSAHPIDLAPFLAALVARYRYAARLCLYQPTSIANIPVGMMQQVLFTHTMPVLNAHERYTPDRRMNLRRAQQRTAQTPGWQVRTATDIGPLLKLFRENHAGSIGVGDWAYGLFEQVFWALQARGLGALRYAYVSDPAEAGGAVPVAGAFFAGQHGRLVYLFNAANAEGRHLNARTLLIDEQLRNAATRPDAAQWLFDFESPEKPGVVQFYESFGAIPTPYLQLSWNRLTLLEREAQWLKNRLSFRRPTS